MTELAEFLLARITEDEAAAQAAAADEGGRWLATGPTSIEASFGELTDSMGAWSGLTEVRRPSITAHITRHDPARVLAECDAKRRIVEHCRASEQEAADYDVPTQRTDALYTLRLLALPYANHPDYRPEWRL